MRNNKSALLTLLLIPVFAGTFAQTVNYSDSTITRPASYKYKAQFLGRLLLGSHYREVWSAPVTLKYLDISNMYGGLKPTKRGGGFQTKSLRFIAPDSNQYVIRTIDKDPSKTVAEAFRNTIITDVIQDQISASHPYGFMVVPGLSQAAFVYHTNPRIFYVPDDPNLGEFRTDFRHEVVLFEERKLDNANVEEGLGGFTKVKDTWEVYEALHKNSESVVDERFVLRSRLFDMMIGDWDRHEDQWMWAQFNPTDSTKLFRPIPRDRDQVFFHFDGVLPTIASLNVTATRKMQRFKPMPVSVKWFSHGARYFDHNFLTRMTRSDWRNVADSLLFIVSDEEIANAFKVWPDTIFRLSGPEIIKTLKSRRNNLPLIADEYYEFLAHNVSVVGTNKTDYFDVKRLQPNITDVTVYDYRKGKKGKIIYRRTFYGKETKHLQLFGLDGNDLFNVEGTASAGGRLRLIGGNGTDTIRDQSKVGGLSKRNKIYDTKEGNVLLLGSESADKTSVDTMLNTYSTASYEYNSGMFLPMFGYSSDDGIFIGAMSSSMTFSYKKGPCPRDVPCTMVAPYSYKQSIGFDVAFLTGAFNFFYKSDYTDVIRRMDLNVDARIQAPNYRYNFFGFGNETVINDSVPIDDYRLRINQMYIFPALEMGHEDKIRFLFGPYYSQANVLEDSTISFILPELGTDNFSRKHFGGVNTQFTLEPFTIDTLRHFQVRFQVNTGWLRQLEDTTVNFFYTRGYISFFYHFYNSKSRSPVLTLATRFGGGYNSGDYEFYQANIIGGRTHENVRGHLGERFAGDMALYNNFEVRLKLFHFNAYLFPADFGIIGLVDNGRVWHEDANGDDPSVVPPGKSSLWHTGYGGGLWLSPFSLAVLSATYTLSEDEPDGLLNIKLGWWF